MSDLADDPVFKGRAPGGILCEDFVRAVRKHAFAEKKARDDEYMADYAMTCLTGDALHWSETLSLDVRGDWSLLRPALLAQYGSASEQTSSSSAPILDAVVPTPTTVTPISPMQSAPSALVQVPTNTPGARRGRIRIELGTLSYYILVSDEEPPWCHATPDVGKATILEAIENGGSVEFQPMNPSLRGPGWLGMVWQQRYINPGSYAGLFRVGRQGSEAVHPKGLGRKIWEGPISVVKWTCSVDSILTPILDNGEGIIVGLMKANKWVDTRIYMTNHLKVFKRNAMGSWEAMQLVFEPV